MIPKEKHLSKTLSNYIKNKDGHQYEDDLK